MGLDPLTVRDATANNLALALDFASAPDLEAPRIRVPAGPFGSLCAPVSARASVQDDWQELGFVADAYGWPR